MIMMTEHLNEKGYVRDQTLFDSDLAEYEYFLEKQREEKKSNESENHR